MPRAIIYAVVICTLMLTGLVAYDMHQRGTLLPKKEAAETVKSEPKESSAPTQPSKNDETIAEGFKKSVDKTKAAVKKTVDKINDNLPKANADKVTITAEIKGIRTTRGNVVAQLYDDLNAFNNNNHDQAVASITVPAKGFDGKLRFENLKQKQYALVLFHDENSNQRYDQNSATIEGYAYSNGAGKTSLPNFHQAAFSANKDKQLIINMIYH